MLLVLHVTDAGEKTGHKVKERYITVCSGPNPTKTVNQRRCSRMFFELINIQCL